MALVTLKQLYEGYDHGFAVSAFNVHNMEYVQGVMMAAEKEDSPVILMVGAPMIKYFGLGWISTLCKYAAESTDLPVVVHLDHAKEISTIVQAIRAGFSSVMYDGSHLSYNENVENTRKVVEIARYAGVSVEGELGAIGGVEDDVKTLAGKMTTPQDAERFVRETNVDALAVAIGNCHGLYKGEPNLDFDRLDAINRVVDIPIVLHGGSDISEEIIRQTVKNGVRKFNVGTDLKIAFTASLREAIDQNHSFEPPKTLAFGREAVKHLAQKKMRLLECSGKGHIWRGNQLSREANSWPI